MSAHEKYGATGQGGGYSARDAAHRLVAPVRDGAQLALRGLPAEVTPPAGRHINEPMRLVDVDHPDRSSTFPVRPVPPVFLRVDHTRELPLIAMDELGKEVARFSRLADLAHYLKREGEAATLPFPIVRDARREDGDQLSLAVFGDGGL